MGELETKLRVMLSPSENGDAPRAAEVRALRGEITALKSEIRAREAFGTVDERAPAKGPKMRVEKVEKVASSEVDAEEAEMLREIEELERERDMLMQLRALEEENEQLRKIKGDKASKAEAERREAQAAAEAKAAAEARAAAEAKAAADAVPAPLDNSATSKLLNRSVSLRTPEEKAAALEELKATARARVRAEVEAKLADLRARNILSADVETTAELTQTVVNASKPGSTLVDIVEETKLRMRSAPRRRRARARRRRRRDSQRRRRRVIRTSRLKTMRAMLMTPSTSVSRTRAPPRKQHARKPSPRRMLKPRRGSERRWRRKSPPKPPPKLPPPRSSRRKSWPSPPLKPR